MSEMIRNILQSFPDITEGKGSLPFLCMAVSQVNDLSWSWVAKVALSAVIIGAVSAGASVFIVQQTIKEDIAVMNATMLLRIDAVSEKATQNAQDIDRLHPRGPK